MTSFGYAVGLSGDASHLIVSDEYFNQQGIVYGFDKSGARFPSTATITITAPIAADASGEFGYALALRPDNQMLAIANGYTPGHIYIYAKDHGVFSRAQTLENPVVSGTLFGLSVAMSNDGNILVAGDQGTHVYVYTP